MLLSYYRSCLNMIPMACKSKEEFLIWCVSGDNMLRLHCASDIPFCCLYTPSTLSCPLTTSNSFHILLSGFSTSPSCDSRNNCTKQHPFLHICSLSFTRQCLLPLHLWKLSSPGQEWFLCLHAAPCLLWLHGPSGAICKQHTLWGTFSHYGKSPRKTLAHGPLMTQLLEALGNGFFDIFSGG